MFRTLVPVVVAGALAFGLGIWTADRATAEFRGFGSLGVDGWVAYPSVGTRDADAYARAHVARAGEIPLSSAEGLAFIRSIDDDGAALDADCSYDVEGQILNARAWLLSAAPVGPDGADGPPSSIANSYTTAFERDGSFSIRLAKTLTDKNWGKTPVGPTFALTLTMLDTTVGTAGGISIPSLPSIRKGDCDG